MCIRDRGETVENECTTRTTEEGRRYEEATDAGINLMEAQAVMKAEDKIDRRLYREKVKAKHKEKRIKERRQRERRKMMKKEWLTVEVRVMAVSQTCHGCQTQISYMDQETLKKNVPMKTMVS